MKPVLTAVMTILMLSSPGLKAERPTAHGASPAAHGAPSFPSKDRLHVLLIGPPHGYDGGTAAECTLLESLSNIGFSMLPVPHDGGDHIADVDGHFGRDPRWIAVRKAEILQQLKRPHDAVVLAARVDDAELQQALSDHITGGGVLIWLAGDKAPDWLATTLKAGISSSRPEVNPLSGLGLGQAGIRVTGGKPLTEGMAVVYAYPGVKTSMPLAAYTTVGRGRVMSVASQNGSMFPVAFAPGVDGDWLWAQAFERMVRFAARGTIVPAIIVDAAPAKADAPPALEQQRLQDPCHAAIGAQDRPRKGDAALEGLGLGPADRGLPRGAAGTEGRGES